MKKLLVILAAVFVSSYCALLPNIMAAQPPAQADRKAYAIRGVVHETTMRDNQKNLLVLKGQRRNRSIRVSDTTTITDKDSLPVLLQDISTGTSVSVLIVRDPVDGREEAVSIRLR